MDIRLYFQSGNSNLIWGRPRDPTATNGNPTTQNRVPQQRIESWSRRPRGAPGRSHQRRTANWTPNVFLVCETYAKTMRILCENSSSWVLWIGPCWISRAMGPQIDWKPAHHGRSATDAGDHWFLEPVSRSETYAKINFWLIQKIFQKSLKFGINCARNIQQKGMRKKKNGPCAAAV